MDDSRSDGAEAAIDEILVFDVSAVHLQFGNTYRIIVVNVQPFLFIQIRSNEIVPRCLLVALLLENFEDRSNKVWSLC